LEYVLRCSDSSQDLLYGGCQKREKVKSLKLGDGKKSKLKSKNFFDGMKRKTKVGKCIHLKFPSQLLRMMLKVRLEMFQEG